MKKTISIFIALTMILVSLNIAFPVFADTGAEVDTVVDELSELYQEEAEDDKSIEDSVASRVIVKANMEPDTYGNAEMINGTDDIYIYQYETASEATSALEYYNSLNYVKWAETDGIMEGQSLSYGNPMVGGDEVKTYISNHSVELNDVNVALVDSGVLFSNEMFDGRVTDSGVNLTDSGETDTADDLLNGHGSHIASIIIDNTPDNVHITAYKVLNRYNQGTNLAVATGINMAVENGADIISLSTNASAESEVITEAVKNAYANGVIIVNSAGNNSDDVANYYPSNMDEVFTVGAIDSLGNRAFFSNFGEEIDFVAPGHKIEMSGFHEAIDTNTPTGSGTSFSVPYVVAATAMVLSVDPELGIEEVKQRLIDSCIPMKSLKYNDGFHEVQEYDPDTATYIAISDPETDEECYGYGMPQILKAMQITENNNPVEFSVQSGSYHDAFELTLKADEGSDIYYTTEEVYPSPENSILYTGPIEVSGTMSVRAIAVSDDKSKSTPVACEYKMSYYADEDDFEIDDRGYITNYSGNLSELIVPETIDGITVKGVAEFGMSVDFLKTVIFPDTVEELEDRAMQFAMINILIGHGIKIMGNEVCWSGNIVILDTPNLEKMGDMTIPLYKGRVLNLSKLSEVGDSAFADCHNLKEANLPSLKKVPYETFYGCYVLRTVHLDSVEYIDTDAFAYCYRLKNIYVPNLKNLTEEHTANDGTFYRCFNITEISFPNVESISSKCFNECHSLVSVSFQNVKTIGIFAFNYCYNLENIYFPNVENIKYGAFYFCNSIKEMSFPKLKEFGNKAFANCQILESFIAPELERLGEYAFTNYSDFWGEWLDTPNLKTLIVPNVETVDDYAFAYLSGLTELDLPNLKTIGENTFYESNVNYLYAPELQTAGSLPVAENSVVVVSDKLTSCTFEPTDKSLTIQGVKDSYSQEYADLNGLEFIDVNAMGGSIRVTDAGLRFGYSFYDTQKKNVEEYGFVYAQGEKENNEITVDDVDSSDVLQLTAYNRLTHEDETTTYNLVFIDIPQTAYNTEISARAYVKIDGIYYYSDTLCYSFNDIAQKVMSDDEIDQNTKNSLNNLLEV